MPYEIDLIPGYASIVRELQKTIERRDIIDHVARETKENQKGIVFTNVHEFDPLSKHKEHPREAKREQRIRDFQKERERKFKDKLRDWYEKEKGRLHED